MNKSNDPRILTSSLIQNYKVHLIELEKSPATVDQYVRYIIAVSKYMNEKEITRPHLSNGKITLSGYMNLPVSIP